MKIKIGRLNSTNVLFCLDHGFCSFKKKINSVIINNLEINRNDNKSFYDLGLNNKFNCIVK